MFEDLTQEEALNIIVRAALKRTYDKGDHITNAQAFSDAVTQQALANEAAVPGSLRIAYTSAAKHLASDEPARVNPAAYKPWTADEDNHPVATPTEANRWQRIIATIQTLPANHELRVAVRRHCTWVRPWDAENRRPTPEEEADAEYRAIADLEYLEHVANQHDLGDIEPVDIRELVLVPPLDEDDDIPGYGDTT